MDKIEDSLSDFIDSSDGQLITKHLGMITGLLFGLQFLLYFIGLIVGLKSWFITLFLAAIIISLILVFGGGDDDHKLFRSEILVLFSGFTAVFSLLSSILSGLFVGHLGASFFWLILQGILTGVACVIFLKSQNETITSLRDPFEETLSKGLIGAMQTNKPKPGDTVLGYDPDTGKPNVQPLKDRYVHTQVYGPTGSGKTSQILLPMILRDMQVRDIKVGGYEFDSMGQIILDPKGDLAMQVFRMANILGGHEPKDAQNPTTIYGKKFYFFDPMLVNSPKFNPLDGSVAESTENIVSAFSAFSSESSQYFQTLGNNLVRNSMKVIKRLKGNDATLLDLETVMNNTNQNGRKMVNAFAKLETKNESEAKDNQSVVNYFNNEYYAGMEGNQATQKIYENSSSVRDTLTQLTANPYLRAVLNPAPNDRHKLNFNEILANGDKIAISTNQSALKQSLSRYLGLFLMLQIQSAILSRPMPEDSRRPAMFYIDEFQTFANPNFEDVLTQGRSYHVGLILATQTRGLLEEKAGSALVQNVSTNARTMITFPGGSSDDAEYFSKAFGGHKETDVRQSVSQSKGGLFSGGGRPATISTSKQDNIIQNLDANQLEFGDEIYKIAQGKHNEQHNIMFYKAIINGIPQPGRAATTRYIPVWLHKQVDANVEYYNAHFERLAGTGLPQDYDPDLIAAVLNTNGDKGSKLQKPLTTNTAADDTDTVRQDVQQQKSDIHAETAPQDANKVDHELKGKSDIGATLTKELEKGKGKKKSNKSSNKSKGKSKDTNTSSNDKVNDQFTDVDDEPTPIAIDPDDLGEPTTISIEPDGDDDDIVAPPTPPDPTDNPDDPDTPPDPDDYGTW